MGETGGKTTGVKEREVGEDKSKGVGSGETGGEGRQEGKETGGNGMEENRTEELFCSSDRGG